MPVDQSVNVPVYDIDLFENPASVVASLHARGRRVICYVDVGSAEDFRPDYASFPPSLLGRSDGWPGERWLDIRRIDLLGPIMARRFDQCRAKRFDGIEADLVEASTNDTGFPITDAEQLRYNRYLAGLAHARGLAIGLKNDVEQVPDLIGQFDFAVDEQCFEYSECDQLTPFIARGKAVFQVEYNLPRSQFCAQARAMRFSSMVKDTALDAWRVPC